MHQGLAMPVHDVCWHDTDCPALIPGPRSTIMMYDPERLKGGDASCMTRRAGSGGSTSEPMTDMTRQNAAG